MIWYALDTQRGKEFVVERILSDDGFDVRVPIIHNPRRIHRKSKRSVLQAAPHFPGWVFIGFNDDEIPDWQRISRINIVRGLVSNGRGDPIAFPAHVMGAIMRDFHQRPVRYTREVRKKYRSGILAEIISGPYAAMDDEPPRKVRVVPIPHGIPALVEVFTQGKKEAA